jgi:DNA mismatch endonuclease (patch repair protein)
MWCGGMADIFDKETRSRIMSKIRSKNTAPEKALKTALRGTYLRYHPHGILGNPDFANKTLKIAVFVDGDFWHGWDYETRKPRFSPYWRKKIRRNMERDKRYSIELKKSGWTVIRIWEHDVHGNPANAVRKITRYLSSANRSSNACRS